MLTTLLHLPLALLPLSQDWTPLPLPSLCARGSRAATPLPLIEGSHLELPLARDGRQHGPAIRDLPPAMLLSMLEDHAEAAALELEFHRSAPPLLVRGSAEGIAATRSVLDGLEQCATELAIDLEVWLLPIHSRSESPEGLDEASAEPGGRFETRIASGGQAFFGTRTSTTFLGDYLVEVAADSGAAAPIVGAALTGHTLYLKAARVDGGESVHLSGVLDLAELSELSDFDPGTADLGTFQIPTVDSVQVVFAGTPESGETLRVSIQGAPLEHPDWTLWVRATTTRQSPPREATGWGVLDLNFLAADLPAPPQLRPGVGLEHVSLPRELVPGVESLPASAVSASILSRRSSRQRRSTDSEMRLPMLPSGKLLFIPWSDAAAWEEAHSLVDALESARLDGGRLSIQHGELSVELPVTHGTPARVIVGRERTLVLDYDIEIATETWMPSPDVRTLFDGLYLDALPDAARVDCTFWESGSGELRELERSRAHMGRIQLPARSFRADRERIPRDAAQHQVLRAAAGSPALRLSYAEGN